MRRVTTLLVLATFVLAVAGCGGSDNSSGETSTTTTTEETTTTTSEATETETAMEETETTTEASGFNFSSGDCLELAQAATKLGEALAATGGDSADLENTAELYRQFADQAPEEIRADLRVLADAFATYVDKIKGLDLSSGGTPSAADLAKLQEAAASLDSQKITAASQHVSAWTTENCKS